MILQGEARRISTFATFARDWSHSIGTTFLCEKSGVAGRNAKECHSQFTEALGNRSLPCRIVARWAAAFQRGRFASADMRRTGRPRTVRTDVARAVIAQCLEDDRRWSLLELQAHTGIDKATMHKILREDLHMRKIAVKWVPDSLTDQHKMVSL